MAILYDEQVSLMGVEMATSGELADVLKKTLGIKLGTVNFYGQALRDAGLLSVGGRGPSGAAMTRDDAVHWLLAMCCAETAKSAPAVVKMALASPLGRIETEGPVEDDHELLFPKAKSVSELMGALFADEEAGRLDQIVVDVDFRIGLTDVRLVASSMDGWRIRMQFLPTIKMTRRTTDDELLRKAYAKRFTGIGKRVIEEINKTLREGKRPAA